MVGSLGETAPPTPGQDLVTNIDSGLEQTLQQALDSEIASLKGKSTEGAAVALDPETGAVLALVSAPTYDPTWWTNGISTAHFRQIQATGAQNNNAIQGLYTPGSTFKLATATAALGTGLISPGYTFNDTGAYTIPGCATGGEGCTTYHDNEGEAAGYVNVSQALTVSSDIFFYNLGVQFWNDYEANGRYGETPIQDAAAKLGYGDVTGIDLPDETHFARVDSPKVVQREHAQDPKDYPNSGWFTGNNLEMAFGQGGTVITPIEQAVAYATFANGGTRYVPEIAAGLVDADGKVDKTFAPKVAGHIGYTPADYQAILSGFEGVVQNPKGTASSAFTGFPLSKFPLAGKTGTATTNEQQPNSWFVAWGPVPNPRYLIAVVVEGGGLGSQAAAPVVRQGFDFLVAHPEAPVKLAAADPATTTTTTTSATTHARAQHHDHDAGRHHHLDQHRHRAGSHVRGGRWASRHHRHDRWRGRASGTGPRAAGSGRPAPRLGGHMTSLWPRIEPLLAQVTKPARYIGGELGALRPEHGRGQVAWLLLYPDTYEIGLPNQGLQILYEILNERADAVAERAYAPWTDMEAAMRAASVPLFSLESNLAAGAFDVLAFNLSAELTYTNVLNLVDLAGVPVRSAQRDGSHPLVVAGGHCAFNPEPLTDFVDAFVLGDGEEVVGELTEVMVAWRASGGGRRADLLRGAGGGARGVRPVVLRSRRYEAGTPHPKPARWPRRPRARCSCRRPERRSGRSPIWGSGPIPSTSWCRSPRSCTTASTWRSSGAARGGAASARRA